jgi:mono/diheme cytochrome c family protein
VLLNSRDGQRMGDWKMIDSMIVDGLWDVYNQYHMGITAENVAKEYKVSREAQDALALASQQKAAAAQDAGRGRLLYETHCGTCHYERVHQRIKSDVKDLADLRDTVARWASQTKHNFTLDELEDVVTYLNESHYRFGLAPDIPRRGR